MLAYQDGAQFYDCITGALIASYPQLVKNDEDVVGAFTARIRFLREHQDYQMEE